jgi:hypothetical protein
VRSISIEGTGVDCEVEVWDGDYSGVSAKFGMGTHKVGFRERFGAGILSSFRLYEKPSQSGCPAIDEILRTPIADRWSTWDCPNCDCGCGNTDYVRITLGDTGPHCWKPRSPLAVANTVYHNPMIADSSSLPALDNSAGTTAVCVNLPTGVQRAGVSLVELTGTSNNQLDFDIAQTEETCLDDACATAMATCLSDYACTQLLYGAKACYADPDADVHGCYVTELANAPSSVSSASRALLVGVKDCITNSDCIDHFNYATALSGFTPTRRRLAGRRLDTNFKKGTAQVTLSGSMVIDGVQGMDGARTNNPKYDDAMAIATGKKSKTTTIADPMSQVVITITGEKTTVAIKPTAVGNPAPTPAPTELPAGVDSEVVLDTTTSVTVTTNPADTTTPALDTTTSVTVTTNPADPTTRAPTPAHAPTHLGETFAPTPPMPTPPPTMPGATFAPTQYQETTQVDVTTTEHVEETHHKITHSMSIGGFNNPEDFTVEHANGFKNAIASHAGVESSQVNITEVAHAAAGRMLSNERQLAGAGIAVKYEIHSMTEEQATAAHTKIAEVASAPAASNEFLSTLTSAFTESGASGHTELTVTAEVPEPPAQYTTTVVRTTTTTTTVTAPAAVPTPAPTPLPTMEPVYKFKVVGQVELQGISKLDFETDANKLAFRQDLANSAQVSYGDVKITGSIRNRRQLLEGDKTVVLFEVQTQGKSIANMLKAQMATPAFSSMFAKRLVASGIIATVDAMVFTAADLSVDELDFVPPVTGAASVRGNDVADGTISYGESDGANIMTIVYAGLGAAIIMALLMCTCWCKKQASKNGVAPNTFQKKGKGKHKVANEDDEDLTDLVPVARPVSRESAMPIAEVHVPRRGPPLSDAMSNLPKTKHNAVAPGLAKMSAVRVGVPVEEDFKGKEQNPSRARYERAESEKKLVLSNSRAAIQVKTFSGKKLATLPTRPGHESDVEDDYLAEQRLAGKTVASLPPRPPASSSSAKSKKYSPARESSMRRDSNASEISIDLEAGDLLDDEPMSPNMPLTPEAVGLRQLSIRDTESAELVDEIVSDGSYDSASEYSNDESDSGASASELSSDEETDEEFYDRRNSGETQLRIKGKGPSFSNLMSGNAAALKPIPMRKVKEEEEEKVEEEDEDSDGL